MSISSLSGVQFQTIDYEKIKKSVKEKTENAVAYSEMLIKENKDKEKANEAFYYQEQEQLADERIRYERSTQSEMYLRQERQNKEVNSFQNSTLESLNTFQAGYQNPDLYDANGNPKQDIQEAIFDRVVY